MTPPPRTAFMKSLFRYSTNFGIITISEKEIWNPVERAILPSEKFTWTLARSGPPNVREAPNQSINPMYFPIHSHFLESFSFFASFVSSSPFVTLGWCTWLKCSVVQCSADEARAKQANSPNWLQVQGFLGNSSCADAPLSSVHALFLRDYSTLPTLATSEKTPSQSQFTSFHAHFSSKIIFNWPSQLLSQTPFYRGIKANCTMFI